VLIVKYILQSLVTNLQYGSPQVLPVDQRTLSLPQWNS